MAGSMAACTAVHEPPPAHIAAFASSMRSKNCFHSIWCMGCLLVAQGRGACSVFGEFSRAVHTRLALLNFLKQSAQATCHRQSYHAIDAVQAVALPATAVLNMQPGCDMLSASPVVLSFQGGILASARNMLLQRLPPTRTCEWSRSVLLLSHVCQGKLALPTCDLFQCCESVVCPLLYAEL